MESGTSSLEAFSGYRWTYFFELPEGALRSRAESFLRSVNWPGLLEFATKDGISGTLLSDIGLGQNHMVRIIEFPDGTRWLARLELPPLPGSEHSEDVLVAKRSCEITTISFLRQMTSIRIPQIYEFDLRSDCNVGAPFTIMECLPGNAGMDIAMTIPPVYKHKILRDLAKIHVQLSKTLLPKIGTITSINEDGTCQQGPIPGLGGPFDTATQFFQAWATKAKFGVTDEQLRQASGAYADEIAQSVSVFAKSISDLASKLSLRDGGPFPVWNSDWGWNNNVYDEDGNLLGSVDWEKTFAAPWELFADYPLGLTTIPPAMDAPWNYDENGYPKDAELAQRFADQQEYITAVRQEEILIGGTECRLSQGLSDTRRQQLASAMRLYLDGKPGFYSKVVDQFMSR
ncbi:phosphotransferase enzyme family-domain-containing protein [Durotheca rogersii]|uniref:phosphotransferase enzyme family-domain-containing protein n=1 Tax=Durotheca rogersii TaxID=419775 RepID=UPI0022204EDA|nr:phosphotransferase enzyme family-domain-containing protein [Durotheca rogersii]KAI5867868.1 phosphotransferase enzyme family-domain-containing protein [Durotheca rogersii]